MCPFAELVLIEVRQRFERDVAGITVVVIISHGESLSMARSLIVADQRSIIATGHIARSATICFVRHRGLLSSASTLSLPLVMCFRHSPR